jgi:hypothetical protein
MAVTGTRTVRQIVNKALRKAGVLSIAEEAAAELMDGAIEELDAMLKAWQVQPWMWTRTNGSLTLTTAASYTLSPVRPVRILSARLRRNGIDTPMSALTRGEYDELPQKASQGLPTTFYYDRQREAALFYVWPVLAAANGETVQFTYTREVEDIASPNDVIDVPGEWWDCVTLNLAARLAMEMERPQQAAILVPLARAAMLDAGAGEMDESVFLEVAR